jgi:DNA-binding beta-propeller fold protein YncE
MRPGYRFEAPRSIRTAALLLPLLLAGGCAPTPEKTEPPPPAAPPVYPPPPEPARFIFERSIQSSADIETFEQQSAWRQTLTGETGREQGMAKPFDVAVCQGQIFISDTVQRSVLVFDVPERRFFEIGTEEPGILYKPLGLATDDDCDLYVADATSQRIMVFNQGGAFLRALGGPNQFERLSHVAVDGPGTRVYAVDTGGVDSLDHRVRVFDAQSGAHLYDIGTRGEEAGQFNLPRDIDIDAGGQLYVVDGGNFRLQVLEREGKYLRTIGSIGRQYGQFSRPKGVALDLDGNIYVSDAAHGNFQIFDQQGQLLLFVGDRSEKPGPGVFMLPAGIDVDEDGRVYMVDQFFRKLDVFRPASLGETEGFVGAWNLK